MSGQLNYYPCGGGGLASSNVSFISKFAPGTPAHGDTCAWEQSITMGFLDTAAWRAVTFDAQGNVYLAGFGSGAISGGASQPTFLTKLDASGKLQWSIAHAQPTAPTAQRVATDGTGNVYVLSSTTGQGLELDKYDPTGTVMWTAAMGGVTSPGANFLPPDVGGLVVDSAGNATLVTDFTGTLSFPGAGGAAPATLSAASVSVALASLDPSGAYRWGHVFPVTQDPNLTSTGAAPKIALGPGGQVVIGGTYWSTIDLGNGPLPKTGMTKGDRNVFLGAFDASGALVWAFGYGKPHTSTLANLAGNGSGRIAVVGSVTDEIDFGSFAVTAPAFVGNQYPSFVAIANLP